MVVWVFVLFLVVVYIKSHHVLFCTSQEIVWEDLGETITHMVLKTQQLHFTDL